MSARVYQYGCLAPIENREIVDKQMRLGHRYRNTLVEIERGRRAALRPLFEDPAIALASRQAKDAVRLARDAIKMARSKSRAKDETEMLKEALKEAQARTAEASRALGESRRALFEASNGKAREDINERAKELGRSARAYCGVYWGTYLLAEAAVDAARGEKLFDGIEPNDPRFKAWNGEGAVGVQIQGGMGVAEVFACTDTRLRIERTGHRSRGGRREHVVFWLRVESEGRDPVWAKFPAILHRPLPSEAIIKNVVVKRSLIGPRERWHVNISLDTTACDLRKRAYSGVVAVNLGWRVVPEEIRVATWLDDQGQKGHLVLGSHLLAELRKAAELRSVRDENFNAARASLAAWLGEREVPEWLRARTIHLAQWRAPGKLAALTRAWKAARFDGDAEAYDALEAWRYHDHHLWEWEASVREKSLLRRRDLYRVFAADLARRYADVIIEDVDRREFATKPEVGDAKEKNDIAPARSNRFLVAPSDLEGAIANACRMTRLSAVRITITCHACGTVEQFDSAKAIWHRCESCGEAWDQDVNACANMLGQWRERPSDDETADSPEKQASKRALARRDGKRKKRAARELGDRAAE